MKLRNNPWVKPVSAALTKVRFGAQTVHMPPEDFSSLLPYEHLGAFSLAGAEGGWILMNDGSIGGGFQIEALAHESLSEAQLAKFSRGLTEICQKVLHEKATIQICFESEPDDSLSKERSEENVFARMRAERHLMQSSLHERGHDFRQMKRTLSLFYRTQAGSVTPAGARASETEVFEKAEKSFRKLLETFTQKMSLMSSLLRQEDFQATLLDEKSLVHAIQSALGDRSAAAGRALTDRLDLKSSLGRRSLCVHKGHLACDETGECFSVSSWKAQPEQTFAGMMATLLKRPEPMRVVLGIRGGVSSRGIEMMDGMLRHATDARGEAQRADVRRCLDSLAQGSGLLGVTLCVVTRSESDAFSHRQFTEELSQATRINFLQERFAALAFFLANLPLGFGFEVADFLGREKRCLPETLAHLLPLWRGYAGHSLPMQVMASRGGEKIHLNPFDTDQNAHLAVLAPAGSGKSFYVQNLISSFFAQHHDGYVFVIDKKTSYEVLARLVGEEGCSKVIRPPANYCNPFDLGDSDEALTGLVSLLATACSLADPQTTLRLEEKALLADAIRLAFAAKRQDASLEVVDGVLTPRQGGKVSSPALSDVMAQIAPAAARASLSEDLVLSLSKKLVPFCRGQLYGGLFDREVSEQETPPVTATRHGPSMFLYDLDGVAADPICRVITAQITLLEILAEIRKPQNRSRPGLLVVEEAGVLGSENPELVEFIRDAWKTFRKLGISCVGISNEVDDFQKPGGPAVMWQVSTHKLVLKLDSTELEKARTGSPKDGLAPLIRDEGALRIMESLKVLKGVYSQGVWMSPDRCGSFVFFPTAFDVWCGASKPAEVEQMRRMARKYGSYKEALFRLCGCAQKTTEGEMKCALPS